MAIPSISIGRYVPDEDGDAFNPKYVTVSVSRPETNLLAANTGVSEPKTVEKTFIPIQSHARNDATKLACFTNYKTEIKAALTAALASDNTTLTGSETLDFM